MKRSSSFRVIVMLLCLVWATAAHAEKGFILMASTIGPIDAGIVAALEDGFEKETGINVRHVGAGTGKALKISEKGSIDLVMVHARSLEEKFVAAGYGTERIPLMYNDFVIVGPAGDPAGIRGMKSATAALKVIAGKSAPFISRGDKSGTHVAEMELWKKAGLNPVGAWYKVYEKGSEGNVPTLRFTSNSGAYTIIDRATYLSIQKEIKLGVLVEGDEALLNRISLIPVSQKKFPAVNSQDTAAFVAWLTAPDKGQKIIAGFGVERFGGPLFFPDSREWHARKTK
ncbi:MAG: tungsten ABC transporter permease [Geobacteraceae bacterium GWC2_55_20]|nr:MAG: tungsten ABC transporter permease [Geobacteraceae bacterium GWC2_55_20]OGU25509.1 MAG: tungsten ABC transporter permease [Geobacteraceae bacterium GWF2_54_21]HCE68075.1 tungsten ABC transporter permease [Geobacter sp.]